MAPEQGSVERILDEVRQRVRARRALGSAVTADDVHTAELQAAMQDVNIKARVNSHLPLLWEDIVIGRLRSFVQRVVRRLLRWYINPIVDQQNQFNGAAANALTLLSAENARLRRELAEVQERLSRIERPKSDDRSA